MGLQIPITESMGQYVVDIPEEYVPLVRPVEIPEKVMISANTYVYGGGGIVKIDDIQIPRTGIWGNLPIPIGAKLTHFRKTPRSKWIYIPEEPKILPGFWRPGFWRASIPRDIRVKYRILPDMEVQLVYTERVSAWLVAVYHLGKEYYARWYPRIHIVRWVIEPDNQCYNAIDTSFKINVASSCDCHIERDLINADIIFSNFGAKQISKKTGITYRNMVVKNYVKTRKIGDYPELMEIRVTYLMCCYRENYQSTVEYMKLMDALRITLDNLMWFFIPGLRTGEKKGILKIVQEIEISEETTGEEELKKVSYGEVSMFPFYIADKYMRLLKKRGEYEYGNAEIDKIVNGKILPDGTMIVVDQNGFIWMRR